jgi:hypothetical protein
VHQKGSWLMTYVSGWLTVRMAQGLSLAAVSLHEP